MSEDAPTLTLSSQELYQWAQTINMISGLASRIRARRERDGRLAHSEGEHAAQQHEARQHPPIRLMSDDEQLEWQRRVPSALAAQQHGEPFTVWTAQIAYDRGAPTGEWGLEAHTWDQHGAANSSLFVVCRDAEDALAMTRHLREFGTTEHLGRLHELAERGRGQFVRSPQVDSRIAAPLVLSEEDWEAALRRELSPALADKVVVKDPAHPHHAAWRELHDLANDEVARVGADPARLAMLVRAVPRWREDVRNPPALAHWAITESRVSPGYERIVTPQPTPTDPTTAPVTAARTEPRRPLRLAQVRSPAQALAWARGLDQRNPEHRIEAKFGFGRWGSEVDGVLATKFPGLVQSASAAAKKDREQIVTTAAVTVPGADPAEQPVVELVEPATNPARLAELAAEVDRLDPAKPIDRRAAHMMLGHVPTDIDRMLAEKFSDHPQIVEKVAVLYPDGLPEADAAVWRNRAAGDNAAASAESGVPDDPRTPRREDIDAAAASQGELAMAAQERGIAATVVGQRPEVVRRTVQQRSPQSPVRRT